MLVLWIFYYACAKYALHIRPPWHRSGTTGTKEELVARLQHELVRAPLANYELKADGIGKALRKNSLTPEQDAEDREAAEAEASWFERIFRGEVRGSEEEFRAAADSVPGLEAESDQLEAIGLTKGEIDLVSSDSELSPENTRRNYRGAFAQFLVSARATLLLTRRVVAATLE